MDLKEVVSPGSSSELPQSLDEGPTFDIANGPTKFYQADVRGFVGVVYRYLGNSFDPVANRVSQVRHYLHRLSKVITFTLLLNDRQVYLSSSNVVFP